MHTDNHDREPLKDSSGRKKRAARKLKGLSESDKLDLIRQWLALVDDEIVRAITGEIVEAPANARLLISVCTGYGESFHRVKFALAHGWLPAHVDHIDRDRRNNRLSNLRAATPLQNNRNRGPMRRKEPGLPRAVYPSRLKGGTLRFRASVAVRDGSGKKNMKHLGTFDTALLASAKAEEFLRSLHGEFYCPRTPALAITAATAAA